MDHPTFSKVPDNRPYVHTSCGQTTTVDGDEYLGLCDPMSLWLGLLPQSTMCVHCGSARPLNEFVWADTKETLAAYRARLRQTIPLPVRWFIYLLRIFLFVSFPVAGFLLGRAISGTLLAVVGALVGAFIGLLAVGMQMLMGQGDRRKYR